jgi:formamidopyrimidine-DNA glycosylase
MPEFPEIFTLSKQMNKELSGCTIKEVQVLQEKCINLPTRTFVEMLQGRSVEQVTSRGKWVFARFDHGVWLLLNLGMGGDTLLHDNSVTLPNKYQLRIDWQDGRVLTVGFWWFGYAHAVDGAGLSNHKMTAGLGLTPIRDAAFTEQRYLLLLQGRKGAVKNFLMNQKNIAGIGNVYIQDILFRARLHPLRELQSLTTNDKVFLYHSIMQTLTEAVQLRGLAFEKDMYGRPGGIREFLVGYRQGEACPVCGTTIEKIKTGSTASYICPNCQRLT